MNRKAIAFGTIPTAVIAMAGMTVATAQQAHASLSSTTVTPTQTVDTTAPGTPRNGWVWLLPDGTTMGTCAAGYGPQWNTVHDYTQRAYSATVEQADGTTKRVDGLTWAQWSDLMANSGVRNPMWYYVGDLSAGTETTNPVGYDPAPGALYEGDCVADGTALPTPNDHFNGDGNSYPIVTPTPTPEPSTTPSAPVTSTTPSAPATSTTPSAPATSTTPSAPVTTPTKPSSPVTTPTKPKPAPVTRYYQHDIIRVVNKAQAAQLAQLIHKGTLPYRGDRLSWGHSTWSFTTVAKHSTGRAVVGQTVDLYWAIDTSHGAKPQQQGGLAWGPKHNLPQTLVR